MTTVAPPPVVELPPVPAQPPVVVLEPPAALPKPRQGLPPPKTSPAAPPTSQPAAPSVPALPPRAPAPSQPTRSQLTTPPVAVATDVPPAVVPEVANSAGPRSGRQTRTQARLLRRPKASQGPVFTAVSPPSTTGGHGAILLRYWHGAPARLQFVVRGPAPSCRTVDRIATIGRPGLNSVVLRRRLFVSGSYLVSARRSPSGPELARVLLRVGPADTTAGQPERPRCGGTSTTIPEVAFEVTVPAVRLERQRAPARDRSPGTAKAPGVLGAVFPPPEPPSPPDDASSPPTAFAAALAVAVLLSLGGAFLVLRRARSQPVEVLPHGYRPSGRWVEPVFESGAERPEAQPNSLVEGRATVVERAARPARGRSRRS